jgi:gamma-glutamyltranspeptidase/glutathione hydrolase
VTIWRIDKDEGRAAGGMVATMNQTAAQVGVEILARGGNAIDAAAAVAFALGVVEPFNGGLGGSGAMVIHLAQSAETMLIDYSPEAPAAAHDRMYDATGEPDPSMPWNWSGVRGRQNAVGHLSVGLPTTVAGLTKAVESFGTLALREVLAPSITLAEEGFEADWYTILRIAASMRDLAAYPETARTFLPGGYPPQPAAFAAGDRIVQPDLGRTLRAIADDGPGAFYHGPLATAIADDMRAHGGLLTEQDMATYAVEAVKCEPLGTYRGLAVHTSGGHTGGTSVMQALKILEGFDLGAMGVQSPLRAHILAETFRLIFADRYAYLGDPRYVEVPIEGLLSNEYAAAQRARIDLSRAQMYPGPGDAWAYSSAPAPVSPRPRVGQPVADHGTSTTHVSVVDRDRNAVSLTQTLGLAFGSKVTPPGTGVLLHDLMVLFDPEPGGPNSIAARKRPLFPIAPTVVVKDGRVLLCAGAPGDVKIITALIQVISNVVDLGMSAQAAVAAPRLHTRPGETSVNARFSQQTIDDLRERGHQVEVKEDSFSAFAFAFPAAIVDDGSGVLTGGVDPLKPSRALGLEQE